ncbi:MAG: Gfo/Idh/MocA family oxidoreductase [Thermosipho sp. (in: Bacteria)]|nr:Gfo/Idh/MocA family oxidoreductase [Thermosipho sp. (in: thermotogales)]
MKKQKRVITYGTFDLFHEGHYNILKRAKELGDYLIVGVTSEEYDRNRGKLNVVQSLTERIENVRKTGLANEIIVEEYEGQKIDDIKKYKVDVFVIGSDWKGKFDYLKEYCEVVYLDRTKGISSTKLRNSKYGIIKTGIIGSGRMANRFIPEAKYVSGISIEGVYGRNEKKLKDFMNKHELLFYSLDFNEFLEKVDAVYIATPHHTHYEFAKKALLNGKHVLCEKPLTLNKVQANELFEIAQRNNLVLIEGIKTAYCPGFIKLINILKTNIIGNIVSLTATFTKLVKGNVRELDPTQYGGSITELSSYVILPAIKIFGPNYDDVFFYSVFENSKNIDIYSSIVITYKDKGFLTGIVGLGAKSEGSLVVSGTNGYIYVPSPWWKTEYFEIRNDNAQTIKRFVFPFEGDGLRYEIAEFVRLIRTKELESHYLTRNESLSIINIIEKFLNRQNVHELTNMNFKL